MWINFKQIKYYQISTLKAEIKISYTVWILLTKTFKQEFFFCCEHYNWVFDTQYALQGIRRLRLFEHAMRLIIESITKHSFFYME
jgi:hypothetical protein